MSSFDDIFRVTTAIQTQPTEAVRNHLTALINELINRDFNSLLQLLYRIDVDENKISRYLEQYKDQDAAEVLADLIIDRQLQKMASRKQPGNGNEDCGEEKW